MKYIHKSALILAQASKGNPITSVVVVLLFMMLFNITETAIEKIIFGERFEHFLDPIFSGCFVAYAAYSVYMCAVYNSVDAKTL